jgi:hypothetical protein
VVEGDALPLTTHLLTYFAKRLVQIAAGSEGNSETESDTGRACMAVNAGRLSWMPFCEAFAPRG